MIGIGPSIYSPESQIEHKQPASAGLSNEDNYKAVAAK
jgi:hypothetical protein